MATHFLCSLRNLEILWRKSRQNSMKLNLNFDLIIKVLLLFSIGVSSLAGGEISEIVLKAISDAYIQVSVFVAASLYLLYYLEHVFSFDIGSFMLHSGSLQPFVASFLGALPGCGGAIIVVTNYTKENISFGSVVACLIANNGRCGLSSYC